MFRTKIIIFIIAVFIGCLGFIYTASAAPGDIKLIIDGRQIENLPVPPIVRQERILVPAREVFENLGASVEWRASEKSVYITYKERLLKLTLDQSTAYLENEPIHMPVAPTVFNGKTMIPVRFPAEAFGFEVEWRGKENAVYINTPVIELPPGDTQEQPSDVLPEPPTGEVPVIPVPDSDTPPSYEALPSGSVGDGGAALAQDISPEIPAAIFPETTLTTLLTPQDTHTATYTAVASSSISQVQKFLLSDNRLVIDIYNAKCELSGPFYTDNSVPVSGVRASQFMDAPRVTRLVFDITGQVEYSVTLSADRTRLTVSFARTTIDSVMFLPGAAFDDIVITGGSLSDVYVDFPAGAEHALITVPGVEMRDEGAEEVNGVFVTQLDKYMRDDGIACIVATMNRHTSYDIIYMAGSVTVRFFQSTYQNISYDGANRMLSIPKAVLAMDIQEIVHTDNYINNRYILTLPVNAEEALGYGIMYLRDGYIDSVSLARDQSSGNTQIIIHETRTLAVTVYEDDVYYYIKAHLPRELYPRIVMIDAGHGGTDPGTNISGYQEKNINLGISLKLMQILESDLSIKAYATRLTDVFVVREERPQLANRTADLFVSIHVNAAKNNTSANGIEVWYWPHYNDDYLGLTSKRFAEITNKYMIDATGATNRGVKQDEFVVLRDTTIPAILCETGFLTNASESAKLVDESYQWQLAWAIYQGICEAFNYYQPLR